jgi:CRISPR-associated protein Cmr1
MKTIEATYRIVTPMFIGGANQKPDDGIRPPSFKGALRFWWRTLNWGKYQDLATLHKKECELFGGSAEQGGQGAFTLSVSDKLHMQGTFKPKAGHQYLLGQGLYHFKEGLLRDYIHSGEVNVKLRFKPTIKALDEKMESVRDAMILLGYFGGLGSRSRKGFGSLSISALKVNNNNEVIPQNARELEDWVKREIVNSDTLPPFSAFSSYSRIDISQCDNNALDLLNIAGNELQLYRGYGRKQGHEHKINGKTAEQNFVEDHDLVLNFVRAGQVERHPDRAVFGLPHNYFFSSIKKSVDIEASGKGRARRASPLFCHIHQFPGGKYALVQTLLPAQYLPEDDKIKLKHKRDKNNVITKTVKHDVDWHIIHGFLNRFPKRVSIFGGEA